MDYLEAIRMNTGWDPVLYLCSMGRAQSPIAISMAPTDPLRCERFDEDYIALQERMAHDYNNTFRTSRVGMGPMIAEELSPLG